MITRRRLLAASALTLVAPPAARAGLVQMKLSAGATVSNADQYFTRCTAAGVTFDTAHHNAYQTLIDGLTADGVWSTLDALYVFATVGTNSIWTLNLVSSSWPLTTVGSGPTFTVDTGVYVNDQNTADALNTGFNPVAASGAKYTLTSATMAIWNFSATNSFNDAMGSYDGTNISRLLMQYNADGKFYSSVNNSAAAFAVGGSTGSFIGSLLSGTCTAYWNGSSIGSAATPSPTMPNVPFFILSRANNGPVVAGACGMQASIAAFGGGWTSTQVTAFYTRCATYLDTIHGSH